MEEQDVEHTQTLYTILNVSETASIEEIKKAYRKAAAHYHPDTFWGDKGYAEEKMKEINHAYEILKNPESRTEYDQVLQMRRKKQNNGSNATSPPKSGPAQQSPHPNQHTDNTNVPPQKASYPPRSQSKSSDSSVTPPQSNVFINERSNERKVKNAILVFILTILSLIIFIFILAALGDNDDSKRSVSLPTSTVPQPTITVSQPSKSVLTVPQPTITSHSDTTTTTTFSPQRCITLGSTQEDVKGIMGAPREIQDYTYFTIWYYEMSTIGFDKNGKVNEWSNRGNLNVWIGDVKDNAVPISIGSSQSQVVDAMGTPNEIQDYTYFAVWHYGRSTITFDENGKVKEWSNYGELKLD